MNKKYLSVILFSALMLGTAGTFSSCKDYDDDIENLQEQITANKLSVDKLEQLIKDGLVVTGVEKVSDGVNIKFSNGQTYELKNGAKGDKGDKGDQGLTGAAGKDAVVWTIKDGYWYKNDEKTPYKAIGTDGAKGDKGDKGDNGADGANGYYYVPNETTKCFDVWVLDENGEPKKVKETNISYLSPVEGAISVVHDGNKLYISGAVDDEGNPVNNVELTLGEKLASVAFVPEYLDQYSKYPLTKFYHVDRFLDEKKYVTTAGATKYDFTPQTNLDKSSEASLVYRVNPKGAYVEGASVQFINRSIAQTRAIAGDKTDLLKWVGEPEISGEKVTVKAVINASKRMERAYNSSIATYDIAALQLSVGTGAPVTSDFMAVRSEAVVPVLADSVQTVAGAAPVTYYNRTKAIVSTANPENDAFVKKYVPIVSDVAGTHAIPNHLKFKYKDAEGNPGSIDLRNKVGLFVDLSSASDKKWLTSYGINSMSYKFSLPEAYTADDANHTNQQWFVKLNGSVLSVNTDNLTGGLTQAIGRRPVVRVDAFLTNNAGAKKLVASAYIRLEITATDPVAPVQIPDHNIDVAAVCSKEYHALTAADMEVANMSFERINNEIYGVEGLTATTFWNYYGGASDTYGVKVITYDKLTGNELVLLNDNAVSSGSTYVNTTSIPGLSLRIDLNAAAGTTSVVKVGVNNLVKTENTYKDKGNGAQYKVVITVKSDDTTQHGNFVLTQIVNVKEDCVYYDYNPLYYFNSYDGVAGDYIIVKGQLNSSNKWEISSQLKEHFKKIAGNDIFNYYAAAPYQNVKSGSLKFKWDGTGALPATAIIADDTLKLDHAMSLAKEIKTMKYEYRLANDEVCTTSYKVVFVNPFVAGTPAAVSLHGNAAGEQKVATAPSVIVKDNEVADIYSWNATTNALKLSTKATNVYKVAAPTVAYAWDTTDADYTALTSQMSSGSVLNCNSTTGEVTWKNEGATLTRAYNLHVKATVTFAGLSEVTMDIPVTINNTSH